MNALRRCVVVPCVLAGWAATPSAWAQPTVFTYQGKLDNAGAPAQGVHDFRFRLFDAASGGAQIGSAQCIDNLAVERGLFTATLDFGQVFSTPDQRFLEIDVRSDTGLTCGSSTGFQTLAPRQLVTAAPMAIQARSAFSLAAADGSPAVAVFVDPSGNVGVGTLAPITKLHVDSGDRTSAFPPTDGSSILARLSAGTSSSSPTPPAARRSSSAG